MWTLVSANAPAPSLWFLGGGFALCPPVGLVIRCRAAGRGGTGSAHPSRGAVMGMVARIKSLLSKKGPKPAPRPQPPSGPYRPGV